MWAYRGEHVFKRICRVQPGHWRITHRRQPNSGRSHSSIHLGYSMLGGERMTDDVGRLTRGQEQHNLCDLCVLSSLMKVPLGLVEGWRTLCYSVAAHWVQLADLRAATPRACIVKSTYCHACFNQPRADRVNSDVTALQLPRSSLCQIVHTIREFRVRIIERIRAG